MLSHFGEGGIVLRQLLLVLAVMAAIAPSAPTLPANARTIGALRMANDARRCTLRPGTVRAVLEVLRDTILPFAPAGQVAFSYSTLPGMTDNELATAGTTLPAARVRLTHLDSATRAELVSSGILDPQPQAYIRAAPYRADCQTIKWTDTLPWTKSGDTGYVVATLASREQWIDGRPVLIIPDTWSYPYPRHAGPAIFPTAQPPFASPEALFSFEEWVHRGRTPQNGVPASADYLRVQSIVWAQSNVEQRERDPIRWRIRESILSADFARVRAMPSRFSGTYRVEVQTAGRSASWQFRTVDRPAYRWQDVDTARTVSDLIDSPHLSGYRLVGYAADSTGVVPQSAPRGLATRQWRLVWLAVADRPTMPDADNAGVVMAMLEFQRKGAPQNIWSALDGFVPATSTSDSLLFSRMRIVRTAADDQPRLPLTLRIGREGAVRADTTIARGGQQVRVILIRESTVALARPF